MPTDTQTNTPEKLPPIHPGEILEEEFLIPMGISRYRLAKDIGVDATRIHSIVNGDRSITAEIWMGVQTQHDREIAEDQMAERLAAVTPWHSNAES